VPKFLPTDASLTFKSDVNYKKSLHSFYKAKSECERNKSVVSTTKKAEAIKEMNFKEFAKKEQEKLKEEKEKAKKKERYESLKAEFQEKMKNYREEEESRIKDH